MSSAPALPSCQRKAAPTCPLATLQLREHLTSRLAAAASASDGTASSAGGGMQQREAAQREALLQQTELSSEQLERLLGSEVADEAQQEAARRGKLRASNGMRVWCELPEAAAASLCSGPEDQRQLAACESAVFLERLQARAWSNPAFMPTDTEWVRLPTAAGSGGESKALHAPAVRRPPLQLRAAHPTNPCAPALLLLQVADHAPGLQEVAAAVETPAASQVGQRLGRRCLHGQHECSVHDGLLQAHAPAAAGLGLGQGSGPQCGCSPAACHPTAAVPAMPAGHLAASLRAGCGRDAA